MDVNTLTTQRVLCRGLYVDDVDLRLLHIITFIALWQRPDLRAETSLTQLEHRRPTILVARYMDVFPGKVAVLNRNPSV